MHRGLINSCKKGAVSGLGAVATCENRYEALYKDLEDNVNKAYDNKDGSYVLDGTNLKGENETFGVDSWHVNDGADLI